RLWTTCPTDLVARAAERRVPTLRALAPASARRRIADDAELGGALAEAYARGVLVLVGFAPGDPDLFVVLERLLTRLSPPEGTPPLFVGTAPPGGELLLEHGMVHVAAAPLAFLAALAGAFGAEPARGLGAVIDAIGRSPDDEALFAEAEALAAGGEGWGQ